MGDLHVDTRNSPPVVSPEEMAGRFHGEWIGAMPDWKRRLGEDPSRLAELEHDVRVAFSRGADLVVAGLIALVMKQPGFEEACEQTRRNYRFPLSRGRLRPLRIRLLGGLLVWVDGTFLGPDAMAELVAMHLLRNGQWRRVVEELTGLAEIDAENEDVRTEIAYLRKHGEAGRLQYPTFRTLGLPLGSGAIESGIRRVINLRLKNNGMFWREEHAEEMLQVRAQVISKRWDERVKMMRQHLRYDGRTDWKWEPDTRPPTLPRRRRRPREACCWRSSPHHRGRNQPRRRPAALEGREVRDRLGSDRLHRRAREKRLVARDDYVGEREHAREDVVLDHPGGEVFVEQIGLPQELLVVGLGAEGIIIASRVDIKGPLLLAAWRDGKTGIGPPRTSC
jgi:hypothetical protein